MSASEEVAVAVSYPSLCSTLQVTVTDATLPLLQEPPTLYVRLGGEPAMKAVVDAVFVKASSANAPAFSFLAHDVRTSD